MWRNITIIINYFFFLLLLLMHPNRRFVWSIYWSSLPCSMQFYVIFIRCKYYLFISILDSWDVFQSHSSSPTIARTHAVSHSRPVINPVFMKVIMFSFCWNCIKDQWVVGYSLWYCLIVFCRGNTKRCLRPKWEINLKSSDSINLKIKMYLLSFKAKTSFKSFIDT